MNQKEKTISQAIIKRLPRYYRYLGDLKEDGVERISSSELSEIMDVTASQIRQDLNNFGGFGQQGYGYNVDYLHAEIGNILGVNDIHKVIIIGAGNLAGALTGHKNFIRYGFDIIALFDNDPSKIGKTVNGINVYSMELLKKFIKDNKVEIVALTLPKDQADIVAKMILDTDIKGIWNFAHTDLDVPKRIEVENVHLSDSLMKLCYNMNHKGSKKLF